MTRTHDLAGTNGADLTAFRQHALDAEAIGHWRRLLAMFGDHHEGCAVVRARNVGHDSTDVICECGWDEVFHVSVTALSDQKGAQSNG
jgi:hypothetical protein